MSKAKVPSSYLNKLLIKEQEDEDTGNAHLRKKPRLQTTDTFTLPPNSSHASPRQPPGSAFCGRGREVRKIVPKTEPEKATVIDKAIEMYRELYAENVTVDAKCSLEADNMQEPRPANDDCPEAESAVASLMLNNGNESVQSNQSLQNIFAERKQKHDQLRTLTKYEVVPSSQPEDYQEEASDVAELERLLTPSRSKFTASDSEMKSLFDPRVTRSQNKSLVPYDVSPLTSRKPPRHITRSFEAQDESDFYIDSPSTRKGKSRPSLPKGKIPELPADYDQELDARNFQVKGRKQCNETFGELAIKGYDLYTLRTRQYVNDTVIDNYLKLVSKRSIDDPQHYRRSFAFGTYFYTMLNNGQDQEKLFSWIKENLFEYELIFLPINQESHWFLFVADLVQRNYFIYDSLYDDEHTSEVKQIADFLKYYAIRMNNEIDWDDWSTAVTKEQLGPTQTNGVDCGVFLCQYAEHLSRRAQLDFSQHGMVNYRKIMLYELMRGELIPQFDDSNGNVTKQEADDQSALI